MKIVPLRSRLVDLLICKDQKEGISLFVQLLLYVTVIPLKRNELNLTNEK